MTIKQFTIILPTFNEAGNIVELINAIKYTLKRHKFDIIVVDDNSPDKTASLVKNRFLHDSKVQLIIRRKNPGLAASIYEGIRNAKGQYIIVMDTDFNHNPEDLTKFINLCYKFDLIIGSRYIKGGGMQNKFRYILSFLYNYITGWVLHLKTHDNLSGYFLINRNALNKLDLKKIFVGYGDYFLRLLYFARLRDFSIKEVPIYYKNRMSGKSKSKFLTMFYDYSKTVLRLKFKVI